MRGVLCQGHGAGDVSSGRIFGRLIVFPSPSDAGLHHRQLGRCATSIQHTDLLTVDCGLMRQWGSLGWGLASILTGKLADGMGIDITLVLYAVLGGLLFATLSWVVPPSLELQKGAALPSVSGLRQLLRQGSVLLLLTAVFFSGVGEYSLAFYLPLHLTNSLGASTGCLGYMLFVQICSEVAVFSICPWLQSKLQPGTYLLAHVVPADPVSLQIKGLLVLSQCAFLVKSLIYPTISNPWSVLAVEALHGICFACMWQAAVNHIAQCCPPALQATGQSVLVTVYMALSGIVARLAAGVVFEFWGMTPVCMGSAVLFGLSLCCCWNLPSPQKTPSVMEASGTSWSTDERVLPEDSSAPPAPAAVGPAGDT
eukprot:gene8864-1591_t